MHNGRPAQNEVGFVTESLRPPISVQTFHGGFARRRNPRPETRIRILMGATTALYRFIELRYGGGTLVSVSSRDVSVPPNASAPAQTQAYRGYISKRKSIPEKFSAIVDQDGADRGAGTDLVMPTRRVERATNHALSNPGFAVWTLKS